MTDDGHAAHAEERCATVRRVVERAEYPAHALTGKDVLFHLAEATGPASAASIARRVDLPRPTVYRILDTLVARHLVAKEAAGFVVVDSELRRLIAD